MLKSTVNTCTHIHAKIRAKCTKLLSLPIGYGLAMRTSVVFNFTVTMADPVDETEEAGEDITMEFTT